ncbi:molybdopterin-dependent oxidoreductase [Halioxenophilus sp. WMMB6]|uniref:molybdopterin-dependent oxidoreductase n=1 Tax=Halioxenophilus sp. WMMB6 TaxID=3073815 RepID=UPI00295E7B19|nr:molybdopterin-dependent oxidoreductase [Halioxenophilus sp. WMMB6]
MNYGQHGKQEWIKTTCAYCGVGCGIEAKVETSMHSADLIVQVKGDQTHPANFGRLCSKGLALGETVVNQGRLLQPFIGSEPSNWDQALDLVAQKFQRTIEQHGPDSVAFYVSGQLLTEDYYVANKLMKGFIGSGNIDTNSRLCMSSSVAGHKRAFGTDTVPNVYADFEQAELVVLVGSNLAWCHPVLFQRLKAAKSQRPNMKVVVIDPRHTDTCAIADLHLPIKPGADVLLYNGLLAYLAKQECLNDAYIESHTEGFPEALACATADFNDATFFDRLGVPPSLVTTFYRWVAQTAKTLTVYSQGVNQSSAGVDKVNAIINTHLATGRIGKPGCGPFSVTGQPNAMGGREVGGLANTLAGHLEFDNPRGHELISEFWQSPQLATAPGLKAIELFDAVADGKIKALWIMATNPAASLPNSNKVKTALSNCDFVVVSDCIADTDTTRLADVLLPAQGWAEKSGTVTNSERRISRQRQLIESAGVAKPDWWIVAEVAKRMGFGDQFNYASEADVFREYAQLTTLGQDEPSCRRDLDLSGLTDISDRQYQNLEPLQWPFPAPDPAHLPKRFFAEGKFYTANQRGQFIAVGYRPPQTATSVDYPLVLNSGRIRDQWHTMTRTSLAPRLCGHRPEPFVSVSAMDAKAHSLNEGDIAQIDSPYGSCLGRVRIGEEVSPGQIFMPIHWNDTNSSKGRISAVVSPEYDPISGQPEAKFTPVQMSPWPYQSEAMLVTRVAVELPEECYWVKQTVEQGLLYYIASLASPAELSAQLNALLGEEFQVNALGFTDTGRGFTRCARVRVGRLVDCLVVADRLADKDYGWLADLLVSRIDTSVQRSILSGIAEGDLAHGKQICACKKVGLKTLQRAISEQGLTSVEALSLATDAGTGCGSCLPELGEILKQFPAGG